LNAKISFIAGVAAGAILFGGAAAFAAGVAAEKSSHQIFIDGEEVELDAYNIDGSNYVKLRDIGEAVGFEVYWDGAVQIQSDRPYTGEDPVKEEVKEEKTVEYDIVELINKLRRENGLSELAVSDALMAAAQEQAEKCAEQNSIEHDKNLSVELLLKHGYGNGGAACNLGYTTWLTAPPTELVAMFKNSTGHLKTMLTEDAEDIGVGVYVGDRVYVAMYFGNTEWY